MAFSTAEPPIYAQVNGEGRGTEKIGDFNVTEIGSFNHIICNAI